MFIDLVGSFGVGAFVISLFIWRGGIASEVVVGLGSTDGGIDDGGFGGFSRCGGSVLAAVMAALDSV